MLQESIPASSQRNLVYVIGELCMQGWGMCVEMHTSFVVGARAYISTCKTYEPCNLF